MISMRNVMVALWILLMIIATSAYAEDQEQQCLGLGVNCVCAEAFNTDVYTHPGTPTNWDPADSVTKPCSQEWPNAPIARNDQDLFGTNDAAVLGALPAGHSINWILRPADNNLHIWIMGNDGGSNTLCGPGWARCAIRIYKYKSPNYESSTEYSGGTCHGEKISYITVPGLYQIIINPTLPSGDGMAIYDFLSFGWSGAPIACCSNGPYGPTDPGQNWTNASQRGKWYRLEIVLSNPSGGSVPNQTTIQMFAKNVTDNTAEIEVLNTDGAGSGGWQGPYNLTPPARVTSMNWNMYREAAAGGSCAGWEGFSHMLLAHWATNAGQRIGPAFEIEGGGGGSGTPPAAPTSLRVSSLFEWFIKLIRG